MRKIADDVILSYIEDNLDKELQLKDVAAVFGYSPDYFRHLFRMYYDTSLGDYIRRRRLVRAASLIQHGKTVTYAALLYGFDTAAGFAKAFRKEFGISAGELKNQKDFFLDEVPDPVYDRDLIKVSYYKMPDLRMIGKPICPKEDYELDFLEAAAYWLDHEFEYIKPEDMKKMSCFQDDMVSVWYHESMEAGLNYLLGPVVKNFNYVPDGMVPVMIPAHKYAVFETRRESDQEKMAETIRMMFRYVFWEWIPSHSVKADKMGYTFERYHNKKAAVYVPLL